jgi:hypothetical protein
MSVLESGLGVTGSQVGQHSETQSQKKEKNLSLNIEELKMKDRTVK